MLVVLLVLVLAFLPGSYPGARDLGWGALAGVAGGAGVALLYRALSLGPMSIVAPLTAACAAVIPVTAGIVLLGERLTPVRIVAVLLALAAILLVGQERRRGGPVTVRWDGLRLALTSGVLIGVFFVALARATPASGLWPLVPARVVSVALFAAFGAATRRTLIVPGAALPAAIAGGVLDMLANALYLVAVQRGPLSLMATLASLYPASTILLARFVLGERLSLMQVSGIVCAIVATVLLVSG